LFGVQKSWKNKEREGEKIRCDNVMWVGGGGGGGGGGVEDDLCSVRDSKRVL